MKEAAVKVHSSKKVFLKILQNLQENRVFFEYSCSLDVFFLKKGTPAEVFSCEVYEILGKLFDITPTVTASEMWKTIERKHTRKKCSFKY